MTIVSTFAEQKVVISAKCDTVTSQNQFMFSSASIRLPQFVVSKWKDSREISLPTSIFCGLGMRNRRLFFLRSHFLIFTPPPLPSFHRPIPRALRTNGTRRMSALHFPPPRWFTRQNTIYIGRTDTVQTDLIHGLPPRVWSLNWIRLSRQKCQDCAS